LGRRQAIDGTWRAEGLAVLAWALGLAPLGPHDEPNDPEALFRSIQDASDAASASLRPAADIDSCLARILTIHWRLVEWPVTPNPVDLPAFVRRANFGPLSLDGVPLAGTDLSIRGLPLSSASSDDVRTAASIAVERHRAAAWLAGQHPIYSEVTTD